MSNKALDITLTFVENINKHDVTGLIALLAPDHKFIDMGGSIETDRGQLKKAWKTYLETYPDYQVYVRLIYENQDTIYLLGHTTGSHLNLPDEKEFLDEGVIWISKVKNGQLSL